MNIYFQIRGWEKRWVEDSYEHGEVGHSSCIDGDQIFEAPTLKGCIEKALEFVSGTWLDIYVNEDADPGRFSVGVMENDDGQKAYKDELARWRLGKCRLWSAEYEFVVNQIAEGEVALTSDMIAGFSKEGK